MSYNSLLINTCTVKRFAAGALDAYGQPTKAWADHLVDEPCRVAVPTGKEIKVGAELALADYEIFLGDVDVTEQDRIEIYDGLILLPPWLLTTTYEVLFVADRQNGNGSHHKECFVRCVR